MDKQSSALQLVLLFVFFWMGLVFSEDGKGKEVLRDDGCVENSSQLYPCLTAEAHQTSQLYFITLHLGIARSGAATTLNQRNITAAIQPHAIAQV